jgi:hypothetical protein
LTALPDAGRDDFEAAPGESTSGSQKVEVSWSRLASNSCSCARFGPFDLCDGPGTLVVGLLDLRQQPPTEPWGAIGFSGAVLGQGPRHRSQAQLLCDPQEQATARLLRRAVLEERSDPDRAVDRSAARGASSVGSGPERGKGRTSETEPKPARLHHRAHRRPCGLRFACHVGKGA